MSKKPPATAPIYNAAEQQAAYVDEDGAIRQPVAIKSVDVQLPSVSPWLAIIDRMIEKNTPAEILTKVFEIQRETHKELQRQSFVKAFNAFKAEAPAAIERTGTVAYDTAKGKTEYDHVELAHAVKVLVPVLSKYGLSHWWETKQDDGGVVVTCHVEHSDGHSRSVTLRGLPDLSGGKNAIQAIGSATYYLQRYTFLAAMGMAQAGKDDDAAGAVVATVTQEQADLIGKRIYELIDLRGSPEGVYEKMLCWAVDKKEGEAKDLMEMRQDRYPIKLKDLDGWIKKAQEAKAKK